MFFKKMIDKHFLRKKREKAGKTALSDNESMKATYARAIQIAAMAETGSIVKKRIEAVAEEIKYFSPTSKNECLKTDKKINNQVDDLRALIAGKKPEEKILSAIDEIDSLIAYRKAMLETEI